MSPTSPPTPPPELLLKEVRTANTHAKCYVTLGQKVYNVTSFLDDHPGGAELITEWGGKDITAILKDESSHEHSDSAYDILDDCFIGYVANEQTISEAVDSSRPDSVLPLPENNATEPLFKNTGMSSADDLTRETDASSDYRQHKFLDLEKPLLMQVFNGGFSKEFYLEQVHRPRHYKGGASAQLFGNFLEPLSLTPWWVVPLVWLPPVTFGTLYAAQTLGVAQTIPYWIFGLGFWTIVEYTMHRFLFHIDDIMPDNRVSITLHFLLHGIHHYLPMDRYRLVMPPTLFIALAAPFWKLAHAVFFYNWYAAVAAYCGGVFGYICYDLTHYFLHHKKLPNYWQQLKKYHLQHHFADYQNGFGVTSRFWDRVFGTELVMPAPKVVKTQ